MSDVSHKDLSVSELRQLLVSLELCEKGNRATLTKRLRSHQKKTKESIVAEERTKEKELSDDSTAKEPALLKCPPSHRYHSFLVLDFEATCEEFLPPHEKQAFNYPNEIIEWPTILLQWIVDAENKYRLETIDTFHSYVKPHWRPELTKYCTRLTGLQQSQIDPAPSFRQVIADFEKFIVKHDLFTAQNQTLWITDGPWDLRDFLAKSFYINGIQRPSYFKGKMLDSRALCREYFADKPQPPFYSLVSVIDALGLKFEGSLHSGIDDTRNIANIIKELASRGVKIHHNRNLPNGKSERRWDWMKCGKVDWKKSASADN